MDLRREAVTLSALYLGFPVYGFETNIDILFGNNSTTSFHFYWQLLSASCHYHNIGASVHRLMIFNGKGGIPMQLIPQGSQ